MLNLNFLDRFSKYMQTLNFMKIRPLGAELFHAEGRTDGPTDMTKLMVPFRNFVSVPKNVRICQIFNAMLSTALCN
jgi:hypothetical protein